MRKGVLSVFILVLVCLPLLVGAAEKKDNGPFDVGVRLGAQISNLHTDAQWPAGQVESHLAAFAGGGRRHGLPAGGAAAAIAASLFPPPSAPGRNPLKA